MKHLMILGLSLLSSTVWAADPSVDQALNDIRAVGKEGQGNDKAAAAMAVVVKQGESAIVPTLKAFGGATPAAKNWLRMTVDRIAQQQPKTLTAPFTAIVTNQKVDPAARAFAFDYLLQNDPASAKKLLPDFVTDSSVDLRRMAIADRLTANPGKDELAKLFTATRDKDQAEQIAKLLKEAGTTIDITKHFGYLTTWDVIGPFDSTDGTGFAKSYPAETTFDTSVVLKGKKDAALKWKRVTTTANYGMVNLNQEIGKNMDSVAYATAVVKADTELPCEIRVGSKNAVQIFLNGTKLFEREAYHHGFAMDQHSARGTLKAGENRIVLKVVQNNQKDSWAQDWAFNLRVCDATGGTLPITAIGEVSK